jgi:adenylate kinase family enzyme
MTENIDRVLILVTGIPGAGKSSLGRQIASAFKIPYVDYDTVCQSFLTDIWRRQEIKDTYARFCLDWREASYGTFWNPLLENLSLNNHAVASAPLSKERANPTFFQEFRQRTATRFSVLNIHLDASKEYLRQRLIDRGEERDLEKIENWDDFHTSQQRIPLVWDADRIIRITMESGIQPFEVVKPILDEILHAHR